MRPLIINQQIIDIIQGIIKHAERNPFSMDDLLDRMNKQVPQPGDMDEFRCIIPFGYQVVFSIEDQVRSKVRHLSVSVPVKGALPSVESVREIITLFGFKNKLEDCMVKTFDNFEDCEYGGVDVLEIIE